MMSEEHSLWIRAAISDGRILFVLAWLAIAGCGADATEEAIPAGATGEPPVSRIVDQLQFGDISFYPEPGTNWTALIDLNYFDGFWPGMTGEDAVQTVGEANEHYEQRGERFWIYHRPGAKVTIALKHKGSLFFGKWWRLEAELDPPLPAADLLHRSVVKELPLSKRRFAVVIMNNQGNPAVVVDIAGGQIIGLDWINNPGSGGARDGVRSARTFS